MPPAYERSSTELRRFYLDDLSSGAHYDRNIFNVPPGGCVENSNLVWVDGILRPRQGYAEYSTPTGSTEPVLHLALYRPFTGGVADLCRITQAGPNFKFYRLTSGVWVEATPTGGIPAFLVGAPPVTVTSCNFKGKIFFTIAGFLWSYDGTVVAQLPSLQPVTALQCPLQPQIVAAGDSRLFLANMTTSYGTAGMLPTTYRIAWSDFLRENVWNGGQGAGSSGFQDLPNFSTPITGVYVSGTTLMVFKPRELYLGVFQGQPATYTFSSFVRGPGCVAQNTIVDYRDGTIIWLGDDNVYIGSPGQQPIPIGDKIKNRIRTAVNLTNIYQASAVVDIDNHLYTVYCPDIANSGNIRILFTVNLKTGAWFEGELFDVGKSVLCTLSIRSSNWTTKNLVGMKDGRILEKSFSYTKDAGSTFPGFWKTGAFQVKGIFQQQAEQASMQYARFSGTRASVDTAWNSPLDAVTPESLTFGMSYAKGLDIWNDVAMGSQGIDGTNGPRVYTSTRWTGENFRINISFNDASSCPHIHRLDAGFIAQGVTR